MSRGAPRDLTRSPKRGNDTQRRNPPMRQSHPSRLLAALFLSALLTASFSAPARPAEKPRLLVLTDIGGDPDDQQSMIRLMTCANEFDIEGLLATASGTPGELKHDVVKPELIREIVEAYGKVRDNLLLHAPGYPTAQHLLDRTKTGNPKRGVGSLG